MRLRIGSSAEERRALWRQLEENPVATMEEHRKLWERGSGGGARRVPVATMSRAIRRLGWTYKEDVLATERDEEARARWRERVARLDPERLVFVGTQRS